MATKGINKQKGHKTIETDSFLYCMLESLHLTNYRLKLIGNNFVTFSEIKLMSGSYQ